ncbi:glutathione hydrolase 1 proenzyme-like isoform X3 [Varroa jacobsoni]|uniref:glutathione hydrolase 1 proenzyme-like isoform X3 n=1 Tax=Varroa jacobsoni TaxID=62625 RepID=UPI000BF8E695|nr:glutathione hydrolase 1 proenzyme-like isoform X3 [Varroa jacobsoni]
MFQESRSNPESQSTESLISQSSLPQTSISSSTSFTTSLVTEDDKAKLLNCSQKANHSKASQEAGQDLVQKAKHLQTKPLLSNIPGLKRPSEPLRSPKTPVTLETDNMRRQTMVCVLTAACLITAVIIVYFVVIRRHEGYKYTEGKPLSKTYSSWASAMDEPQCAQISGVIYKRGGTVADAAVASLLCLGVVLPESLGIGGGFLAVYFQKSTGKVHFLDAREAAPLAAKSDMFVKSNSAVGPLSVAVPGELAGYQELLKFVGSNVTYKDLFETAIQLAAGGYTVGHHLAHSIKEKADLIYQSENLRKIYFDQEKNSTKKHGDTIYNPDLAKIFQKLASTNDFAHEFYNGSIGRMVVETLKARGGILTSQDLASYRTHWRKSTFAYMKDRQYEVHSGGLSGSGSVLSMMVNIIEAFKMKQLEENVTTYHRLVEAMKFAYAQRSLLGDYLYPSVSDEFKSNITKLVDNMQSEDFAQKMRSRISDSKTLNLSEYNGAFNKPRDRGTSHASFFAPNGDVIAITSTVNFYFGSGVEINGILLNNEMDDFSIPEKSNGFGLMSSPANYIKPLKRPLSSMAPAVVIKGGEVVMAIGAAGGSQITSAIMEVILYYFYMNYTIGDAIAHSRLHHQYLPNRITYDRNFDPNIIKELEKLGHETYMRPDNVRGSVIVAVVREGDKIVAACDPRKGGGTSGGF